MSNVASTLLLFWTGLNAYTYSQYRKSGWNTAGDTGADPEGLLGVRGLVWGGGLLPTRKGFVGGVMLPSHKNIFFYLKWRVLENSERYFCPCLRLKMLNFPPEVVIWWTLKMHFWEVLNTCQNHGVGKLLAAL